ncbi:hypothetical protein SynWH8103_00522 [Synechococcus sp. WH 8103]|nr:hypothetical protein SynWH8103_00522 [Synechococcus sp. WH 8103]
MELLPNVLKPSSTVRIERDGLTHELDLKTTLTKKLPY